MKLLIVGGYGTFGGRIVTLLQGEPGLTLQVAGRSEAKAKAFCQARAAAGETIAAELAPARFDRDGDLEGQLIRLAPDLVIDASGPFQDYGDADQRYGLIAACIARRIDYLDLADGVDFVAGVKAFDEAAKAAGVTVLSGVSSFPVLTALVVRELSRDLTAVDTIHGGIAPSPFAGVGENVIRAIAGYAGQPVTVTDRDTLRTGFPFTETRRYRVAPPGRLPLRPVLFSLVDVPDLKVLAEIWPRAQTVWMGAGPVPEILHWALIGFSWAVRWRILRSLTPIVPLIRWAVSSFRWGDHRGGMFVEVTGRDAAGRRLQKSWHLIADGDDGPLIPCMAVEAIVRNRLGGAVGDAGARTAIDDLTLADYDRLFAKRTIYTGLRQDMPAPSGPLQQRLLGSAWHDLPDEIAAMHDVTSSAEASGRADVERGPNPLARLIADLMRFPKAATDIPLTVHFQATGGGEIWTRNFDGKTFSSRHDSGRGRWQRLLVERFGPMRFAIALVLEPGGRVRLVTRGWSIFHLPLPLWLAPRSEAYEFAEDGRFRFYVRIDLPLIGMVVRYRGWLRRRK